MARHKGQPDEARAALDRAFKVLLPFGGQCESAEEDLSRIDHPWFTTASGAFLRALARMLLLPQDDQIRLFPGVPKTWTDFAFELPAHGGLSVAAEVKAGRLVRLTLASTRAQAGRTIRILVPSHWARGIRHLAAGVAWEPGGDETPWRTILARCEQIEGSLELLQHGAAQRQSLCSGNHPIESSSAAARPNCSL